MRGRRWVGFLLLLAVAAAGPASLAAPDARAHASGDAAGDARGGAKLFRQRCALCHAVTGAGGQGPGLGGVVGRGAAQVPGFSFSRALRKSGLVWTPAVLDRFLAAPYRVVPGTRMVVAVPGRLDRRALVAYLATLPAPAGQVAKAETGAPEAAAPSASASPAVAADGGSGVRSGAAAMQDFHADAPGVRRRITVADLPRAFATPSAHNSPEVVDRPPGVAPIAPPGFRVDLYAEGLDNPRLLRVAPNGDVLVAETAPGRIRVLRSAPGATRAQQIQVFAQGLDGPFGMAFYPPGPDPRWLYVAENDAVVRFAYRSGDLVARAPPETIVDQLSATSGGHTTRTLVFSADGTRMLVSVGSASNVAEHLPRRSPAQLRAWEAAQGLGAAWGEEEHRAAVLAFDPEGGAEGLFATGLRNCVGLALHPATGDTWCATNERDGMGDDLVPDFITRVREGAFYGWPWMWLGNHEDPRHQGERPDLARKVTLPDVLVQAHSAALQLSFYDGTAFPAQYRGDGFAAFHGSWNRARRTGYKVVRVPLKEGVPTGEYEDFLTGFVLGDGRVWGRPVGVGVARDGALLVSEDGNGTVWRVAPAP